MEPEGPLSYAQEPTAGPNPESDVACPQLLTLFP